MTKKEVKVVKQQRAKKEQKQKIRKENVSSSPPIVSGGAELEGKGEGLEEGEGEGAQEGEEGDECVQIFLAHTMASVK